MESKLKLAVAAFALSGSVQTVDAHPGELAHFSTCPSPQKILEDKTMKLSADARKRGCGFFYNILAGNRDGDSKKVLDQWKFEDYFLMAPGLYGAVPAAIKARDAASPRPK
jgi:hypothetical protein